MAPEPMGEAERYKELGRILRERTSPVSKTELERIMLQLMKFFERTHGMPEPPELFLTEAADVISRVFEIGEVIVALKDRSDGLFHFVAFIGMRKEVEMAYRKLAYNVDDVVSISKFPRIKLSPMIEFYPAEFRPYLEGELDTFNRPSKIIKERLSTDSMQEGDYFCVYFHGFGNEVLGWFEFSRPRNDRLPSREAMLGLELLACAVGRVVCEMEHLRSGVKK